jgi:hypothetical protein
MISLTAHTDGQWGMRRRVRMLVSMPRQQCYAVKGNQFAAMPWRTRLRTRVEPPRTKTSLRPTATRVG